MKKIKKRFTAQTLVVLFGSVLIFSCVMFGNPDNLQNKSEKDAAIQAEKVVDRYVETIGGQKKLDAVQTLSFLYEMNHTESNLLRLQKCYQKRPYLQRREYQHNDMVMVINGDKATAALMDPKTQKRVIRKLPFSKGQSYILNFLGTFLDYKERGIRLTYIKKETIGQQSVHKIKCHFSERKSWIIGFDEKTGLCVQFEPAPGTIVEVKGYKRIGQLLFPTITEGKGSRPDGKKWHHINTLKDIKINPQLDDALFAPLKQ